jgi:hypothetical protein
MEIRLTQGKTALIDDEDVDLVAAHKWFAHKRQRTSSTSREVWYAHTNVTIDGTRTTWQMHRLVMGFPEQDVDHQNGDGLDNRRENLRVATPSQNGGNAVARVDGTSSFRGVSWFAESSAWMANITIDRRQIYLGLFGDELAAARAYNTKALEVFGPFARLNDLERPRSSTTTARKTQLIEAFGESRPANQWAADERCEVTEAALRGRLLKGWDPESAITTPAYRGPRKPMPAEQREAISARLRDEWAGGQRDHLRTRG